MIKPEDVPEVFEVDGSWRDIYLLGTTTAHWDTLLEGLRSDYAHHLTYAANSEPTDPPTSSADIFQRRADFSPLLSINLDGLFLNSHFFCEEEIDFDLDPRELSTTTFDALLRFLRWVGTRLQKVVMLTPENRRNIPLLVYLPEIDQIVVVRSTDRDLPR